jgi:hypothetical protein
MGPQLTSCSSSISSLKLMLTFPGMSLEYPLRPSNGDEFWRTNHGAYVFLSPTQTYKQAKRSPRLWELLNETRTPRPKTIRPQYFRLCLIRWHVAIHPIYTCFIPRCHLQQHPQKVWGWQTKTSLRHTLQIQVQQGMSVSQVSNCTFLLSCCRTVAAQLMTL